MENDKIRKLIDQMTTPEGQQAFQDNLKRRALQATFGDEEGAAQLLADLAQTQQDMVRNYHEGRPLDAPRGEEEKIDPPMA